MIRSPALASALLALAVLLAGCETAPVAPPAPPVPSEPSPEQPAPQPQPPAPEPQPQPEPPAPEPEPAQPPPPPVVVCEPPPAPEPKARPLPVTPVPILGELERVTLDPPGVKMDARLDTGSPGSVVDARNVREFERDGKPWVKFVLVDRASGQQLEMSRPVLRSAAVKGGASRRYVVTLRTTLGTIDQFTEFALADRAAQPHPMVLGRNFLRDQAVVDVSRRFTVPAPRP